MYLYDDIDQRLVDERVRQFRDQTRRYLAGTLGEDDFRLDDGGGFHLALIRNSIRWEDGYVIPPEGPGLGIDFDEDLARAHPFTGTGLHLQMQEAPCDHRHGNRFEGGAPAPNKA